MSPAEKRLLQQVLNCPTAPFHEHHVRELLEDISRANGLRVRRDRFGNSYISYKRTATEKRRVQPIAFAGHMDHPGFVVVRASPQPQAVLLGGVRSRMRKAGVVFFRACEPKQPSRIQEVARGHIASLEEQKGSLKRRAQVFANLKLSSDVQVGDFGHFAIPGYRVEGDILHSKAIDNLISCALILCMLLRLKRQNAAADVMGVFTRAEEVGFAGAGGVLRSRILGKQRPIIVLEASQARNDVSLGEGPVIRVGDRMTSFDPGMDLWIYQRAQLLAKRRKTFRFQRALMTGGACEASLFAVHERTVGALAIPLGNYHNVTPRGSIAAEFVHVDDVRNELVLLEDLSLNPPTAALRRQKRQSLDKIFYQWQQNLLSS